MATENTHYGAAAIAEMLKNVRSIYFIGIGGINMSSLADITLLRGYRVGGSDRSDSPLIKKLEAKGITVNHSHRAQNIKDYDAVVYTVAISPDNEEYTEAKRRNIPCISRADYLGYVMTGYKSRIGIAGMHGKSTCTSMCAETFIRANADPTVLSGAELSIMNGAYRTGNGDCFIFEACEYMDSFLDFNPSIAVILNIEMDHVDYFHSIEQVKQSYAKYASLTGKDGYAIANADDENVLSALEGYEGTLITFGIKNEKAKYRATSIRLVNGFYCYDLLKDGNPITSIKLSVPGEHNIYNSLAAAAVADVSGISPDDISLGLASFRGAHRRMEYKGRLCGAAVYDDYGHHPTEVRTTLEGARQICNTHLGGRLFCVFQSHTYSRTKQFIMEFAKAFSAATRVIFVDIYSARETDTLGVSGELLSKLVGTKASYAPSFEAAANMLTEELRDKDVAIIMGAGDVYKIFDYLADKLEDTNE